MYCSKCGKEIEDNSVFCRYCGNKIAITSESTTAYYGNSNFPDLPPERIVYISTPSNSQQAEYQGRVVSNLESINKNTDITAYSQKNKYVAGTLAILLGLIGAHDFYVGKSGRGFLKLGILIADFSMGIIFSIMHPFISMLGTGLVVGFFLWSIIDGIIFFMGKGTDKFGRIVDVPSRHR